MKRRAFLKAAGLTALAPQGCAWLAPSRPSLSVNDVHSRLNQTLVDEIVRPETVAELRQILLRAARTGRALSVSGGRHAMGGQQFAAGTIHVDTRSLGRILHFDRDAGRIEAEAGIQWPELVGHYTEAQQDRGAGMPAPRGADAHRPRNGTQSEHWGIAQKQTGADKFTLGGSLAANGHGRALTRKPLVGDVESFDLMNAAGEILRCDRDQNSELFRLAIGGYGLFGIMTAVTLRLVPRRKVERVVEVIETPELAPAFERRIAEGFLYGDFQFSIDGASTEFLRRGVFSCYRPVEADRPIPETQKRLTGEDWRALLTLAHTDKGEAFRRYTAYYLGTSGQLYWSDTHQMSTYLDDYHLALDRRLGSTVPASEIITEIYVPRADLAVFLEEAAEDLRRHGTDVIYGTVRLIERDDESFLPWARQAYACVIFNLHTEHSEAGLERSARAFRRLIDMAIRRGGSYFLTYHRFAERGQIEACYPQFREFLERKLAHDPQRRFQSTWWRHYERMFGLES